MMALARPPLVLAEKLVVEVSKDIDGEEDVPYVLMW